jgi:bifunctional non-homologous end joining protein LigD
MMPDRRLNAYHAKRDPRRTPEPMGDAAGGAAGTFVVQKHAARRLHYDFRLAIDGVLKSWAVPRGPSVDPAEKRLAVEVEDHPLEYGGFEGVIPAGSYGAGEVIVWDRGRFGVSGPGTPAEQLAEGRLHLELAGEKLRGAWMLVRTTRSRRDWLLMKKDDAFAGGPEPTETHPGSVLSAASVETLAGEPAPGPELARRVAALGLPPARLAQPSPLMLPTLVTDVPRGRGWLFEIKWDGVRVLLVRRDGVVTLVSRSGEDVTRRYPEVATAAAELPGGDLALDGEVVALDTGGKPSFARLQRRMHLTSPRAVAAGVRDTPVTAYVFDCLAVCGRDLRRLPLAERKAVLRDVVSARGVVRFLDHVDGDGPAFFEAVSEAGLEGIVAKRAASVYRGGRSSEWRKVKCHRRQEFVVGGWTRPRGTRAYLGALHLGVREGGGLLYVGRVGSGFDDRTLRQLHEALGPLAVERCPFTGGAPPHGGDHHWVRPELVCEVRFTEWTDDRQLRHPVFLGLRADKPAGAVRRERDVRPRS